MSRTVWGALALAALAALAACAQRSPEQQVVEDAAAAVGGRGRIEAATALVIEGDGSQGNLGQDMTPEATNQTFTISEYRQVFDLSTGRRSMRVEQTRTPDFDYFRGREPMTQIFGIDGDVAYDVAADGSATRATNATANDRRYAFFHHPLTLLKAAFDPDASVDNGRTAGGEHLVDVTTADGLVLTLAVDDATRLPTYVAYMASHPNLRDVTMRTTFTDYEAVGGLELPTRIETFVDDFRLLTIDVTSQSLHTTEDLTAPEAARAAAPITGPPPPNVTAEEVADGVWFLAGESHHSVLVELSDHALLIEAPNEPRTLAVIAKARELVPDKPLTHLVNTHHHFDHSGGVRAAVSEGLSVITHTGNASFFQRLIDRPSTIVPDALARNPRPLTLEAVEEEARHGDRSMMVELYHIAGNPHADTLLMAYLPRQRLLVEADAFSPGRDYQPYAANLLENIEERGLRVDRILPIHGDVVPFEALVNTVRASPSSSQ